MNNTEELVKRAAGGDSEAFGLLYEQTERSVYYTCLGFLKNENDAQDAVQDVYMTALRKLKQLNEPSGFNAWLNKIAANTCRNILKKKTPEPMEDEVMESLSEPDNELYLPEEYITDLEKRRIIREIMKNTLSDILYRTVMLYYFNGLSAAEIAEITECPVGTVTYRLTIARRRIKEGILEYETNNDDRLHGIAGVPFLTRFFKAEADSLDISKLKGVKAAGNISSENITENGGNVMPKPMNVKLTAGCCVGGAAVAAGIIAAAVIAVSSGGANTPDASSDNTVSQSSVITSDITSEETSSDMNEESSDIAQEISDYSDESLTETYVLFSEQDFRQLAESWFDALKSADIDTLITLVPADCTFAEKAPENKEFYAEVIKRKYGDILVNFDINSFNEDNLSHIQYTPITEPEQSMSYYVGYIICDWSHAADAYVMTFDEGETPEIQGHRMTMEQLFTVMDTAKDSLPMIAKHSIKIVIDQNGKLSVDDNGWFDDMLDTGRFGYDMLGLDTFDGDIVGGEGAYFNLNANGEEIEEAAAKVIEMDTMADLLDVYDYLKTLDNETVKEKIERYYKKTDGLTDEQRARMLQWFEDSGYYTIKSDVQSSTPNGMMRRVRIWRYYNDPSDICYLSNPEQLSDYGQWVVNNNAYTSSDQVILYSKDVEDEISDMLMPLILLVRDFTKD